MLSFSSLESEPAPPSSEEKLSIEHSQTLSTLHSATGSLATATIARLETTLPWYRRLGAAERSAVGLLAQRGIASFVNYYRDPSSTAWVMSDVFGSSPTDLTGSISLQRALQLIRVVVEVVEERVPELAPEAGENYLRESVLRFAREVAFAAAEVYARAAETRGAWDARTEAMIVDTIVRGEGTENLESRTAALGWKTIGRISVMVGHTPAGTGQGFVRALRRTCARYAEDALLGIHGERLVIVLRDVAHNRDPYGQLSQAFGAGPVVYGPEVSSLAEATLSAKAALAGLSVVSAWSTAPRPVAAHDLWPERALSGDALARAGLWEEIYRPLIEAKNGLDETVSTYLEQGYSLEATARTLFVHTNTVRYRLRKVVDVTGRDPLNPRDAFVLHTALVVGRLYGAPHGSHTDTLV